MSRTLLRLLILLSAQMPISSITWAQHSSKENAASIKLGLEKLNTLGSVLYFAAHPDDENTRLIAWLANEKKYRTGYLSLTRGDGGQNLIGTEQAEELGLIRTQELLAARRDDGGEQFFSTANDFGFSKTFDETFRIWNKEKILADAVWVIRRFQPDIIITRFPGDPRAGHGHHQASSLIAQEAFKAAADPKRFPEQLRYVKPWQAKRILWNTFNFGGVSTILAGQFSEDIGQYNPFLGHSYGELAAISRTNHKSQGFGSSPQRGEMREYFETLDGLAPKDSLFDGINTSWSRIPHTEKIQALIRQLNETFDYAHPDHSVKGLTQLVEELDHLGDHYWAKQKSQEVKKLILDCAGIWLRSEAAHPQYALGERVSVTTDAIVQNPAVKVVLSQIRNLNDSSALTAPVSLDYNQVKQIQSNFPAQELTQPYWLAQSHSLGSFSVSQQTLIGMPEATDLPHQRITLQIEGKQIDFDLPIVYAYTDPVRGEIVNPLVIAPPLTINLDQKALVFNGNQPKTLELSLVANKDHLSASVRPVLPSGWRMEPSSLAIQLEHASDEKTEQVIIYPAEEASIQDSVYFTIQEAGTAPQKAYAIHRLQHDHIPQITWFPRTAARLSKVETGTSAQTIGYLPGAGDLVPQALREIGLKVDILSENDILHKDLSAYDALITGIRIYNVNDRIRYLQPKLLEYVKNGGTLVEQYNVNSGLKSTTIGPYPFAITRERVTDEEAEVRLTEPQHPALNYPNKINAQDFDGWIQERGLYFAGQIDPKYSQPLAMNDPEEPSNTGSLLVAKYGKGKYVYTSLAFFRELPAGVPGAYRLFVNLLAKENN